MNKLDHAGHGFRRYHQEMFCARGDAAPGNVAVDTTACMWEWSMLRP